jgi:acid phosphatase class B
MHTGRTPFEWDRLDEDKIDKRLALMLEIFVNNIDDCEVIFLTGRPDSAREATENWLKKHFNAPYTLLMRDSSDYSHGYDAKKKIYEDYIKGKYNVLCVFEDSNKCVDMWREQGLLTLQVQNGDY